LTSVFLAFWVLRSSYFITKARSQKLEKKLGFQQVPANLQYISREESMYNQEQK